MAGNKKQQKMKRKQHSKETAREKGENPSSKHLINQNTQETKTQTAGFKDGQAIWRVIFQNKIPKWPKGIGKGFSITYPKEARIQTTMRYRLTPIRMTVTNRIKTGHHRWRYRGYSHCWWEHEMVQLLWKTVWWSSQTVRIELLMGQQCHCWTYRQRHWNPHRKETPASHVYISLALENHDKVPEMSMERSVDREQHAWWSTTQLGAGESAQ